MVILHGIKDPEKSCDRDGYTKKDWRTEREKSMKWDEGGKSTTAKENWRLKLLFKECQAYQFLPYIFEYIREGYNFPELFRQLIPLSNM